MILGLGYRALTASPFRHLSSSHAGRVMALITVDYKG
jgi:hypothetical protein